MSSSVRAWPVAQIRAAESQRLAQVPEGVLMQRAAAALAAICARELRARTGAVAGRRVLLLVGSGNNGGDALYAGERLARRGVAVLAWLLAGESRTHAAGLAALRAAGGRVGTAAALRRGEFDLAVDGVVGLGSAASGSADPSERRAGLRPDGAAAAARVREAGIPVVAVDLPSGVDPDTGELPGEYLPAQVSVTFGPAKGALLLPPAAAAAGRIEEVDIGLGPWLGAGPWLVERLDASAAGALLPVPGVTDHKYTRGVLGVCAGSARYPGAAVLAVSGAARAGAGMVRYSGPAEVAAAVLARRPEVVAGPGRVQAWVVGSGLDGAEPGDRQRIARVLTEVSRGTGEPVSVLVDAGALAVLPDLLPDLIPGLSPGQVPDLPVLLTPHAGELAVLLTALRRNGSQVDRDQVEQRPLAHAREAAALTGATVLLKGHCTLVVEPPGPDGAPGRVRSQADAPSWLGTAGAGDVLAGVAGALLAAGLTPLDAGSVAAIVHGRAAWIAVARNAGAPATDRGPGDGRDGTPAAPAGAPITALDVADAVPQAVAELLTAGRIPA